MSFSKTCFDHLARSNRTSLRLRTSVLFNFYDEIAESIQLETLIKKKTGPLTSIFQSASRHFEDERFSWKPEKFDADGLGYYNEFALCLFHNYRADLTRTSAHDFYDECDSRSELLYYLKSVVDGYSFNVQSPNTALELWLEIKEYSTITLESVVFCFSIGPLVDGANNEG